MINPPDSTRFQRYIFLLFFSRITAIIAIAPESIAYCPRFWQRLI